jgi:hypothetical protein
MSTIMRNRSIYCKYTKVKINPITGHHIDHIYLEKPNVPHNGIKIICNSHKCGSHISCQTKITNVNGKLSGNCTKCWKALCEDKSWDSCLSYRANEIADGMKMGLVKRSIINNNNINQLGLPNNYNHVSRSRIIYYSDSDASDESCSSDDNRHLNSYDGDNESDNNELSNSSRSVSYDDISPSDESIEIMTKKRKNKDNAFRPNKRPKV